MASSRTDGVMAAEAVVVAGNVINRAEEGRGKERDEKRYNCTYYRRVRTAYWQGRGNSEYDPEPDEGMLSPCLARTLLGPVPDTKTND